MPRRAREKKKLAKGKQGKSKRLLILRKEMDYGGMPPADKWWPGMSEEERRILGLKTSIEGGG